MDPSLPTAFRHVTVLGHEAAALLAPGPGRVLVDCTLGGGGHASLLLEQGATVIGLDKDPAALAAASSRLEKYGERFIAIHADFRDVAEVLKKRGISEVHGLLVDLGVSSPQLDEVQRGFSFSRPGPLDMRMDPSRGEPLELWLQNIAERELSQILRRYGEEPNAPRIARAILRARDSGALNDTRDLAEVVALAIPRAKWPKAIHPATRTFQALRIAVNDELGALEDWLAALPEILAHGGRVAAISFHSLEDRLVKKRFAELSSGCICPPDFPVCGCGRSARWKLLTRKAVVAGEEEVESNPRARSARLRAIERISHPDFNKDGDFWSDFEPEPPGDLRSFALRSFALRPFDRRPFGLRPLDRRPFDLKFSDLRSSDLKSSDLRASDLKSTDLRSSDLRSSDLKSSDLRSSESRSPDLRSSNLRSSDLKSSALRSSGFRSSDLRSSNLRSSDLKSSDLRSSDLRSSDLRSSNLRSSDLKSSDLSSSESRSPDLRSPDLRSPDLRSSDLSSFNQSHLDRETLVPCYYDDRNFARKAQGFSSFAPSPSVSASLTPACSHPQPYRVDLSFPLTDSRKSTPSPEPSWSPEPALEIGGLS